MIQLRNVPDELHLKLKQRAAAAGLSLSDYLIREIAKWSEGPTVEELRARLTARPAVKLSESPLKILHEERAKR